MVNNQGLGPAIPRRRLGAELRRLRLTRDKKLADVAQELLISTSKLSRLEKGHSPVQERDIRDLLVYYGQTDTELGTRMRRWATEGREEPWWQRTAGEVPPIMQQYLQYETAAAQIEGFSSNFIPSLLQTSDYARALFQKIHMDKPAEIENLVQTILHRQKILTRDEHPTAFDVVIDEAALRRVAGSTEVMHTQLRQLIASTEQRNVTLRVLPFSAGPHRAHAEGSFTYFSFRDNIDSDIVNIEGHVTDSYVEGHQVTPYRILLNEIQGRALDPTTTMSFLVKISQEFLGEG